MYVVIEGSPIDGLNLTGPFETSDAAREYAEQLDADWWIAPLDSPEED